MFPPQIGYKCPFIGGQVNLATRFCGRVMTGLHCNQWFGCSSCTSYLYEPRQVNLAAGAYGACNSKYQTDTSFTVLQGFAHCPLIWSLPSKLGSAKPRAESVCNMPMNNNFFFRQQLFYIPPAKKTWQHAFTGEQTLVLQAADDIHIVSAQRPPSFSWTAK